MTLSVGNKPHVTLTYTLEAGQELALHHAKDTLALFGNSMYVELNDPPNPPTCTLTIDDSSGGDVYAWTVTATGLVPWTRGDRESFTTVTTLDHDVLIVHVPTGTTVPAAPSTSGPPAPGTSQTVLRVKVEDQGALPIDPPSP